MFDDYSAASVTYYFNDDKIERAFLETHSLLHPLNVKRSQFIFDEFGNIVKINYGIEYSERAKCRIIDQVYVFDKVKNQFVLTREKVEV